ncbi:hypothetical protein ACFWIW_24655 [Amycolatopsis sp. NPDC058340]|uniref:hypothetical protein n=1 Tax=Amycolatopsis sp. NPDC058340 TaxID=3346453 RepID=UPI0036518AB4
MTAFDGLRSRLHAAGIDADHIVAEAQDIVGRRVRRENHFGEISQEERGVRRRSRRRLRPAVRSSGLPVDTFMRTVQLIDYNRDDPQAVRYPVVTLAEALDLHPCPEVVVADRGSRVEIATSVALSWFATIR